MTDYEEEFINSIRQQPNLTELTILVKNINEILYQLVDISHLRVLKIEGDFSKNDVDSIAEFASKLPEKSGSPKNVFIVTFNTKEDFVNNFGRLIEKALIEGLEKEEYTMKSVGQIIETGSYLLSDFKFSNGYKFKVRANSAIIHQKISFGENQIVVLYNRSFDISQIRYID